MRQVLSVVVVACLVFAQVTAAQLPAIHLADGTKIPLRLVQTISSGTAKNGDVVNFEVIEDIEVDGTVVIKKGTPVRGVVVEAAEKRRMGRAGKLSYTVADTKTVDRQTIRLRATSEKSGDSHVTGVAVTTVAVAVLVPVAAPFFLLRKGKDIVVPEGTRVDAFVDGEHQLTRAVAVAPTLSPAMEKAVALTNADVLALAKAGFSDALIIAKIRGSASAYRLSPTELVQLKTAGLSEQVITAMVEASK
jgi:hypothetical protein